MEYALIGERLGHSYSPMIHAHFGSYAYELKEIAPEDLDTFMKARDFKGLNVTIPYKQKVIPYCAELSPIAQEIGCVNTIVKLADGTLYGHNTDIGGFTTMLRKAGIDPKCRKVVILGNGGTSLTARTALKHMGAKEIVIVSRKGPVDYDALYRDHTDAEILVNTTPVGMYPKNGVSAVKLEAFPTLKGVADVVYNPEKTALILDAEARGIPAVSGLSMLVGQAREAAELFTGMSIPESKDDEITAEIKRGTLNLVLIGMPGSGKSTVGQLVANALHKRYVDTDEMFVSRTGISIPDFFAQNGEKAFRDIESEILSDLCKESGLVISTGGGSILRSENVRAMRQNARVCMVVRDIDSLSQDGRPLSSSPEAIHRLWNDRKDRYHSTADFVVTNDGAVEDSVKQAMEGFHEASYH